VMASPLAERVLAGDPRGVARAISLIEDESTAGADLVRDIYPRTGHAYLIGVTGPPGAGKSTLVDRMTGELRKAGKTVGIVAVDPTSPFSGGAILGDRVRMAAHFGDEGVFIRSMATRGHLGGLARATSDVALVLDAAGKDVVIIETVGVGQDEVDIVRTADVSIVVLVPGTGDEVQALKAGIMEIADIFVVNKSDHDGADRVEREIRTLQSLAARGDRWAPPIVKTVASEGKGIEQLADAIRQFENHLKEENLALKRSVHNWQERLREMLRDALLEKAKAQVPDGTLSRYAAEIAEHKRDPYTLVEEIVAGLR